MFNLNTKPMNSRSNGRREPSRSKRNSRYYPYPLSDRNRNDNSQSHAPNQHQQRNRHQRDHRLETNMNYYGPACASSKNQQRKYHQTKHFTNTINGLAHTSKHPHYHYDQTIQRSTWSNHNNDNSKHEWRVNDCTSMEEVLSRAVSDINNSRMSSGTLAAIWSAMPKLIPNGSAKPFREVMEYKEHLSCIVELTMDSAREFGTIQLSQTIYGLAKTVVAVRKSKQEGNVSPYLRLLNHVLLVNSSKISTASFNTWLKLLAQSSIA